jgi:hypothetical protein
MNKESKAKAPISAEYINTLSVPEYGIYAGKKQPGQVWCLDPKIEAWLAPEENVPVLCPVAIVNTGSVETLPVCEVVPMHMLREQAASTDLLCENDDGDFADFTIATWARRTVFEGHLRGHGGSLSDATSGRLAHMIAGSRDWKLREYTGPVLEKCFDARTDFRRWFLKQIDIISCPVFALHDALEIVDELRQQLSHNNLILEEAAKKADELWQKEEDKKWANNHYADLIKRGLLAKTAGAIRYLQIDEKEIRKEIAAMKSLFTDPLQRLEQLEKYLVFNVFKDTLSPVPIRILHEELAEWHKRK